MNEIDVLEKEVLEEKGNLTQTLQNNESELKAFENKIALKNQIINDTTKTIENLTKQQIEKKSTLFENLLEKSSLFSLEVLQFI